MRKLWESIFYPNLSVGGAAQPIKVHQLACYSVCAKGTDTQSLYNLCPLKIKLSCVPFAAPADSSKHEPSLWVSVGQVVHTVQAVAPEQCWGRLHAATGGGGHGRGQPPAQH